SGLATQPDWFIFTTGIGVQTLLAFAEEAGVKEAFLKQVRSARIAVRGYKAKNALLKENIAMDIVSEDGTT
ncbi:uroporphyrinogen-III synthase, partial [Virgibacillus sp. 7505]